MKRKIAAILAADIADYCKLMSADEEETAKRLVSCRAVFEEFAGRFSGRIVDTAGDSVLAEFPSAVDATRCAICVQDSLRTHNLAYPSNRQMCWRMGVTVGDVIVREGDVMGDGVNIAARLESIAPPGGICISHAVYEQVRGKMSATFVDLGEQHVKNIPYPVHAYQLALGSEAEAKLSTAAKHEPRSPAMRRWLTPIAAALFVTAATSILLSAPTTRGDLAATTVQAGARELPPACAPILTLCEQAGFRRGGVSDGNGLYIDCVLPIISGAPQRPNAKKLPPVDPRALAACKLDVPPTGQAGEKTPPVAAPSQGSNWHGACAQIRTACEQAGFVRGGALNGNGLWKDCIQPIMQGMPRRPKAQIPLPAIDSNVVEACKNANAGFGQGRGRKQERP